jgi:hypothetical protein
LELRPEKNAAKSENSDNRLIYTLAGMDAPDKKDSNQSGNASLSRVRLGASGVHELHETPIILTRSQD